MSMPDFPDFVPRPSGAPLALAGLRVIDFTQMLSGPYATQELADMGADVIKIEAPVRGDDSRHYTTTALAGECAFYLSANRNKRSVTLDLKNEAGREVALQLIKEADIVVENFSNGVMERLGLDYKTVSKDHDKLIYCSISGYGRDDPSPVARRGYDAMFQAASGFMSLTGEADKIPMRTTVPILDTATAMTVTSSILAAVIARARYGKGQYVEVALIDVAMASLTMYGMATLITGEDFKRNGNRAPQTGPSDVFMTRTGPIFVTCGNNSLFRRMCVEGMERPDIVEKPEFATNPDRVRNHEKLTKILADIFITQDRDYWFERLSSVGVPVAPVLSILEAAHSHDVQTRNLINMTTHPKAGKVPNIRSPHHMSMTPVADPVAAPLLGQHNHEVLCSNGAYTAEDYAELTRKGAFGPQDNE